MSLKTICKSIDKKETEFFFARGKSLKKTFLLLLLFVATSLSSFKEIWLGRLLLGKTEGNFNSNYVNAPHTKFNYLFPFNLSQILEKKNILKLLRPWSTQLMQQSEHFRLYWLPLDSWQLPGHGNWLLIKFFYSAHLGNSFGADSLIITGSHHE